MKKYLVMFGFVLSCGHFVRAEHPVPFSPQWLTIDSNEGCAIADFDGDGKPDISAGRNWYRNGDWLPRPVRHIEDRAGYVRSNGEWAYDVNEDGNIDIVSMDFVQESVFWYENPGKTGLQHGLQWEPHLLANTGLTTNETSYLVDLDRDGKPEWISDQWKQTNPLIAWSFSKRKGDSKEPTLSDHLIGLSTGHGIGFGDINGDQRIDILVGTGWYAGPKLSPLGTRWEYHAAWKIQGSCPMIVQDIDGDGKQDVIVSKAHDYGIMFWKNMGVSKDGEVKFKESVIDNTFSQAHCLHMADLDGDGRQELITGKRVRAHNGRDPGGKDEPVVKYYVWEPKTQSFDSYDVSTRSIGIGLQIRTADLDGDSDLDIVLAGKEGTQILFNEQKSK